MDLRLEGTWTVRQNEAEYFSFSSPGFGDESMEEGQEAWLALVARSAGQH